MSEPIVGIARAVRFEQKAAAHLQGARRAGHGQAPRFEMNPEAERAALRVALLQGAVRLSERPRRRRVVARQGTRLRYQVEGVRSSLRIDQIASLGTARRIARPHVGIFLEGA
jgi:hypothetical protein